MATENGGPGDQGMAGHQDYLRSRPVKRPGELPTILIDERAKELRASKVG